MTVPGRHAAPPTGIADGLPERFAVLDRVT